MSRWYSSTRRRLNLVAKAMSALARFLRRHRSTCLKLVLFFPLAHIRADSAEGDFAQQGPLGVGQDALLFIGLLKEPHRRLAAGLTRAQPVGPVLNFLSR